MTGTWGEVARLFLRLGFTAFGGPAAHIGIMHDEIVTRRRWLTDQEFLDLLAAANLIPGPNSTEMAIHIGFQRAGWPGLLAAGIGFILPATAIVTGMAWAYLRFGSTPSIEGVLYGIKPVVVAIIAQALWSLGRKAIKGPLTAAAGLAVLPLYFLGVNEIFLLFAAGLGVMVIANLARLWQSGRSLLLVHLPALPLMQSPWPNGLPALLPVPFSYPQLFLTFLKIGAVLYGSGYVLLAFLQRDFVERLGWLSEQQLLDAVAVGQVTPGPLFTTATFIGYLLGGFPGALLATVGIFLPSFVFVAASNPFIPHLRRSPWASALLDGVIAASLGLMAAVTWQLGRASLADPLAVVLALVAGLLLIRFQVNSTWLIAGGAGLGLLRSLLI